PTAVTARIGMPYFSPSSTSLAKLESVCCSYLLPTKIERARHVALSLIASSIEAVTVSLDKSSPITLLPPDTLKTIGTSVLGITDVRRTPLVIIKESAYGKRGLIVLLGISNLSVGPKKYP